MAVTYAVVAFVIRQVADQLFPALGLRRPELLSEQEDVTVARSHLNLGVSLTY